MALDQDKFVLPDGAPFVDPSDPNVTQNRQRFKSSAVGPDDVLLDQAATVSNLNLEEVATATIKGRVSAGTGVVEDLTPAEARQVIGAVEEAPIDGQEYARQDGGWVVVSGGGGGAVDSVFGRTGDVVAAASDYDASQVDNDSSLAGADVAAALDGLDTRVTLNDAKVSFPEAPIDGQQYARKDAAWEVIAGGGAPVASVFGRTGAVVAAVSDYDASQVDNDSGVAGATVADALDNIEASLAAAFNDVNLVIFNDADPTKTLSVDLSGITTATNTQLPFDDTGLRDTAVSVTAGMEVFNAGPLNTVLGEIDDAILNTESTGWRSGGIVTVNGGDNTQVDVTACVAQVLDNTDPANPTYTPINYAGVTGYQITDLVALVTYLYLDSAGVLQQTTDAPTPSQRRTRVYLARVGVVGGVILVIGADPTPTQQAANRIEDLADFLGTLQEGFIPEPSAANLEFKIGTGSLYIPGINAWNDATDPDRATLTAGVELPDPQLFFHATQDGQTGILRTTIDVGNYDDGGVVTAIPGTLNRASIFTLWLFQSGIVEVQYDDTFYTSIFGSALTVAFEALNTGEHSPPVPPGFQFGARIGWIIADRDATDLSDPAEAIFVSSNQFGGVGGGASGLTGIYLQVANDLADLNDAATARANLGSNDAANLTVGVLADARVQESNVTQHEGALDPANQSSGAAASGTVPTADGAGNISWQAQAGGGDVSAPANLDDEAIVVGDGGGKNVKTTPVTIDSSGNVSGVDTLNATTADADAIELNGSTSGAVTLEAAAVAGTNTATFPSATGQVELADNASTLENKIIDNVENQIEGVTEIQSAGNVLTADEQYGKFFTVDTTSETDLAAIAEGMSIGFATEGAAVHTIDPNGAEVIYLNGVALAAGNSIVSSGASGDSVVLRYRAAGEITAIGFGYSDAGS